MKALLFLILTATLSAAPAARPVRTEIFAPDGRRVATALSQPSSGGTVRTEIFSVDGRRLGTAITRNGSTTVAAPDGRVLVRGRAHR